MVAGSRIVAGAGGWTKAGSLDTMTLAQGISCPGAGHAILAPASLADQRLVNLELGIPLSHSRGGPRVSHQRSR